MRYLGLVLLLTPTLAGSQPLSFHSLRTQDGLSDNRVTRVLQDHWGFMWFGTEDGLNRYDGRRFIVFRHDPSSNESLTHNTISALFEDSSHRLWVGTLGGLNLFDPRTESFTRYRHDPNDPTSLGADFVRMIHEDRSGRLWIGTFGGGLNLFDPETGSFRRFRHDPQDPRSISSDRVWALAQDVKGRYWVGTGGGGLNAFDPETGAFTVYPHGAAGEGNEHVNSVRPDADGGLWVGRFRGGLDYFHPDAGKYTHYGHTMTPAISPDYDTILDIEVGGGGSLWLSTAERGLARFRRSDNSFTYYRRAAGNARSLGHDTIGDLTTDAAGLIWVATWGGGVAMAAPEGEKFPRHPLSDGSGDEYVVSAIAADPHGNAWIGTEQGVLFRSDASTGSISKRYGISDDDPAQGIIALLVEREGTVWVSVWDRGVARLDPATGSVSWYRRDTRRSLSDNTAPVLMQDAEGVVWVGTDSGGLNRYDRRRDAFSAIRNIPGEVPRSEAGIDYVNALAGDTEGRLWVGTWDSGLARLDPNTGNRTYYRNIPNDRRSLAGNTVMALHLDRKGRLWVGLRGQGLALLDPASGGFVAFREKDGLANDFVYAILEDAGGKLWIRTNRGLSRFDPDARTFRNYDIEGMQWGEDFAKRAAFAGSDGRLLFGAGDDYIVMVPDRVKDNTYVPRVVITEMSRMRADSLYDSGRIDRTIYLKDGIVLSYEDLGATFELASLSYLDGHANRYAFRLEGLSDHWIELGTQRRFTIMRPDPGTYTLTVRGSNNDGVWSELASLSLRVLPPWWRTWWAYILLGVAVAAALYGARRYEMNRLLLRNRLELQRIESDKLRELDQAKSRFFANVSHEFRTPLMLILGPLEDLHDGVHGTLREDAREQVELATRSGWRLLGLVDQLLDLARLEEGRLSLRVRAVETVGFVKHVAGDFVPLAARKHVSLQLNLPERPVEAAFDPDQQEKVLRNLLGNALKFTPSGGTVELAVSSEHTGNDSGSVVIVVRDDGPGISAAALPHVFERFYQADTSQTRRRPGVGIGLALAKEIVELHRGTIEARSTEGSGSTFIVRLPLTRPDLPEVRDGGDAGAVFPMLVQESISLEADDSRDALPGIAPKTTDDETTVLIVDDTPQVRAYLRKHLENFYRVVEAPDGQSALAAIRDAAPDLVISDVMMPDMDGFALCRAIKQDPELEFIPIILLTARASGESKIEGLQEGADDYLTKPFRAKELLARAENLISSRRRLKERVLRVEVPASTGPAAELSDGEMLLARVRAVVEARLSDENLSVEDIAEALRMSRATFYRHLSRLLNEPPMELVWQMRLEHAAGLLARRRGSVSEIAYAVGFKSVAHFSTRFRDRFGQSPSAYMGESPKPA